MKRNLSAIAGLFALTTATNVNILNIGAVAANGETITIGSTVYTCATTPATDYEFAPGGDAATSVTNIAAVINATTHATGLQAVALTGAVLLIDRTARGPVACAETLAGSGNAWLVANTYGAGTDQDKPEIPLAFTRTATAAEDTGKLMAFGLPFTPTAVVVQVLTSAGAIKAWDGKATIGTNHVLLNSDGAADIAENDVVTILATA